MKSFVKNLGILFFIILGLMVVLDYIYTYNYKNSPPRNKIQKIIQSEGKDFDFAFFGSSRTESHIDCALIEKMTGKSCINLGIAGATIDDMLIIMKLSESKNMNFDKLFFQIDKNYNTLGNTEFLKSIAAPFIDEPVIKSLFKKEENSFLYRLPFYRYMIYDKVIGLRELLATNFKSAPSIDMRYGFWPKDGKGLRVAGRFPKIIAEDNKELGEIIALIHNQNSELYFFTAPYCNKIKTYNYMEKLEKKIPNHLNYISLFEDKPEFFFDCGHLNSVGAKKFTQIFTKDILLNE